MWPEPEGDACPSSKLGVRNACYFTSNPPNLFMAVVKDGSYCNMFIN
jgi:hypothetical protein